MSRPLLRTRARRAASTSGPTRASWGRASWGLTSSQGHAPQGHTHLEAPGSPHPRRVERRARRAGLCPCYPRVAQLLPVAGPSFPLLLPLASHGGHWAYRRGTAGRARAYPPSPAEPLRRCHWRPPRRAPGSSRPHTQPRPPPPPLASTIASGATRLRASAVTSPKQEARRLVLVAAAARHHRQRLHPDQTLKPMCGEPLAPLPNFPGRSPRRSRRNLASRATGHGQGPHCLAPIRSRGLSAKCISNSVCKLLKLVKFVENRRKFRKVQTQFFWIRGEDYYIFCYTHMVWF
jgi:hypothetical protein